MRRTERRGPLQEQRGASDGGAVHLGTNLFSALHFAPLHRSMFISISTLAFSLRGLERLITFHGLD